MLVKTAFVTHPLYWEHDTGPGHPERPDRLQAILNRLNESPVKELLEFISPGEFRNLDRWIGEIHPKTYVEALREAVPSRGRVYLDGDTPCSPQSLAAAERVVAGVLTAVDHVVSGRSANAFGAVRPPGHHAEPTRAMGFCLFNNVAIGARYIQKRYNLKRIFVVDWDVHHGNGTQHLFYDDPTVFYMSTHQYPFYPGTGSRQERGEKEGEGFTLNCPFPAGAGDREMLKCFEKELVPALEKFKPDFVLISAGFDAHREDPLAHLEVSDEGFAEMTRIVKSLADTHCGGRVVSLLEGGYDLDALARSVERHLGVLSS